MWQFRLQISVGFKLGANLGDGAGVDFESVGGLEMKGGWGGGG